MILLTGFEPFDGDPVNPSLEIAKALEGRRIAGVEIRSVILPVQHEAASARMAATLGEVDPRAIVHVGLAGGRARLALEAVAVNAMDYPIPDAHGDVLRGQRCVPAGPAAYFSTLPLPAILAELTADGVPAYVSYTAGTYLCNYVLYTTLHSLAERSASTPAGFLHVPFLPSMVAAHGREEPSMDLPLMVRGVEAAIRAVAA